MNSGLPAFFVRDPTALTLYMAFEARVCERLGPFEIRVQKTQITFRARYGFAFVSLPPRTGSSAHKGSLIVSFGLPVRVESPRIFSSVEPYPNRWTHHVRVAAAGDLDDELMGWVAASYAFSQSKGRAAGNGRAV